MRSISAILFVLVVWSTHGRAQSRLFLELGGSGGLGSINYEKVVWRPMQKPPPNATCGTPDPKNYIATLRVGLGFSPIDKNNGAVLVFPVMGNIILGRNIHRLEVGAGLAPSITTRGAFYIKSPLLLGYRVDLYSPNLFFRVSYTPIVGWLLDYQWQHWAGISIGYRLS